VVIKTVTRGNKEMRFHVRGEVLIVLVKVGPAGGEGGEENLQFFAFPVGVTPWQQRMVTLVVFNGSRGRGLRGV